MKLVIVYPMRQWANRDFGIAIIQFLIENLLPQSIHNTQCRRSSGDIFCKYVDRSSRILCPNPGCDTVIAIKENGFGISGLSDRKSVV